MHARAESGHGADLGNLSLDVLLGVRATRNLIGGVVACSLGWQTSGRGCPTWEWAGAGRWLTQKLPWSTARRLCATSWSARMTVSGRPTKVRHCHHNQCQQHSQQDDAQAPGQQSVRKADKVEGSNLLSTPMPFPAVVKQARSEASCSPMAQRCLRWRRALTSRRTCGACAAA